MTTTPAEMPLPPGRGRHRFAAIGYALRVVKALPAPLRERILNGASGGVTSHLPPFADLHRLVQTAGGIPNGQRWQEQLLTRRPHLRDVVITDVSDDTDGRLRARLYRLPGATPPTSALVWVHGGAFLVGSLDQEEAHWPAIELAASGIPVLSVDYRPCINGVHYPAPQDDVLTAWRWAVRNADRLGVTPEQLHLGGGSAGGCLVAGVTLRLRDAGEDVPASLYLAYPVLGRDLPPATPQVEAALEGVPLVDDAWFAAMFDNWAGTADQTDPLVAPGGADLQELPPTYVLTCGRDSLRRASEPFAQRLEEAGVATWHEVFPDSEHAPLDRPETMDGDLAIARLRTWIRGGVEAMADSA